MWHCRLCPDELVGGLEGALEHLRLAHPAEYGSGPARWPDGAVVVDETAVLCPEDFTEGP